MASAFRLKLDGPAVDDHEIDVRDLAPALLAISQMVQRANVIANGETLKLSVRVSARGEGSFWIEMVVRGGRSLVEMIKDLVAGSDVDAIKRTLQLLGLMKAPTQGLIGVVKRIRGRKLIGIERRDRWTELRFDDETLVVDETVARMAFDPDLRDALKRVVADPLKADGITMVSFQAEGVEEVMTSADIEAFQVPDAIEPVVARSEQTKVFSIVDLSFKPGKKWRLADGHGNSMTVDVDDEDFLARVLRGEVRFASNDLLVCEVVETTRQTPKGLRADYAIVRVVEHKVAPPMAGGLFDP